LNIVFFGPPGSGKGTYASRLVAELKTPHISTGDLVRQEIKNLTKTGGEIEGYYKRGELVPDDAIISLLKERISHPDCQNGFILDGFPRNITQAEALEKMIPVQVVINLEVSDDIIVDRLSTRLTCKGCGAIDNEKFMKPKVEGVCDKCGGQLYKRDDDKPAVIQQRLNTYRKQTKPLLDYYKNRNLLENVSNKEAGTPPEKLMKQIMLIVEARR
jgi:adenylate kinase